MERPPRGFHHHGPTHEIPVRRSAGRKFLQKNKLAENCFFLCRHAIPTLHPHLESSVELEVPDIDVAISFDGVNQTAGTAMEMFYVVRYIW